VVPYFATGGEKYIKREAVDELKRRISLLEYLQAHDWRPARRLSRGRWMGLCPLHRDHQPSFLVDPSKGLFYCYGCGRGGEVIRFVEIYHEVRFPEALTMLCQWRGLAPLLHETARFYQVQLHRHGRGRVLPAPAWNSLAGLEHLGTFRNNLHRFCYRTNFVATTRWFGLWRRELWIRLLQSFAFAP
jgi:hypothetical protein